MAFKGRLSIGDVAMATGVKVVTIRYYEQIGLLPIPSRTDGNYRPIVRSTYAGCGSFGVAGT